MAALNSSLIPLKTTKTAQGVQVLKPKRGQVLKFMKTLENCGFKTDGVPVSRKLPVNSVTIK